MNKNRSVNRLRELRLERGWTQEYLGELLQIQKSAVSKYEVGRSALSDVLISKLCIIFECSADYLLGIDRAQPSIGNRIRELRLSADMTQEDLGNLLGVVKSTVSLYEAGRSTPNDSIKAHICAHFGVSMDYLLGLSDSKGQKSPLAVGQGDRIIQSALRGTGILSDDGSLTPEWERTIYEYLSRSAEILKLLHPELK